MPGGDALIMPSIRSEDQTWWVTHLETSGLRRQAQLLSTVWYQANEEHLTGWAGDGDDEWGDTSSWLMTSSVACTEHGQAGLETDCGRWVTKWPCCWRVSDQTRVTRGGQARDSLGMLSWAGPGQPRGQPSLRPSPEWGEAGAGAWGGRAGRGWGQWAVRGRGGETHGVWSSGQYQLWHGDSDHQTVTRVTQVRVVTSLWPLLSLTTLARREQSERETSNDQMTSDNISRVWIITQCWPRYTDSENQSREINKTAPRANQSQGKLSWNLRHFAKLFLSLGIVPYPDDLYLSPVAPQPSSGEIQ